MQVLDTLLDIAVSRAPAAGRLIVAIAGGPGSGKSTLLAQLADRAAAAGRAEFFAFLPFDGFHFPNAYLDTHLHEGAPLRKVKGSPPSFDTARAREKLEQLRNGNTAVPMPVYSREIHDPVEDAITVPAAARVVVIEGNYLLHDGPGYAEMLPLFGLKIFIDAGFDLCRRGVIERHIRGGRTPEDAEAYFARVDADNYALVEKTRARADIIIARAEDNTLTLKKA